MRRILIIVLIAALLGAVGIRQANAADPPAGIRYAPPTVALTLDEQTYTPGAVMNWRYTLYNGNDHPLELTFTSAQIYDLVLRKGHTTIARWALGKLFADVMSTRTVMMGETMVLTGSWQLPEDLAVGDYELDFILTSTTTEPTTATTTLSVGNPALPGLSVDFTTDKLIYRVGTKITVRYTITNQAKEPIELTFPTSQQYNWTITDAEGNQVYDWQAGKAFAQMVTKLSIAAGASDTFESSWDIPRDLKPNGFYVHFTLLDDHPGYLTSRRAAVLMGSTPRN
ncbi:MAG: BsuPI-related putative proteinase inhibitor [Candidatus Cryosericum sp.]